MAAAAAVAAAAGATGDDDGACDRPGGADTGAVAAAVLPLTALAHPPTRAFPASAKQPGGG